MFSVQTKSVNKCIVLLAGHSYLRGISVVGFRPNLRAIFLLGFVQVINVLFTEFERRVRSGL